MTHNRQSSGGTKSFSYVGSNLHRGTSNVMFTLRQWDIVRKILPWPRHYQSTSSTVPYKEISTNRLFCFWQEKSKTVSPWKLITGAHIASGIYISNSHREATLPSLPKVWDRQKETYTEATKTKTSSFGEQDWNTEHDIDGRKMITLQHSTKATMPNIHNFSSDKTIFFLDRKSMVKSSHQ